MVDPEGSETRARIHAPLLKELTQQNDMGGADWCDQFVFGFPALGELGEPRVYPPSSALPEILPREESFRLASPRFFSAKRSRGPKTEELRRESMSEAKENWPRGPRRFLPEGEL